MELDIDETSHRKVPALFQRVKHALSALICGAVLAQGLLFSIGLGSIVKRHDNYIYIIFLTACGLLGWIFGNNFIASMNYESNNCWNLDL